MSRSKDRLKENQREMGIVYIEVSFYHPNYSVIATDIGVLFRSNNPMAVKSFCNQLIRDLQYSMDVAL